MSPRPRLGDDETARHAHLLVEATFRVIAATGDAAPSVRPILQEAGLSRQVFYRCFGSKDELLAVVLDEGRRQLASYLQARMAHSDTPEDKVRAWVTGIMRQSQVARAAERTRPFIVSLGAQAIINDVDQTEADRALYGLLEDVIADGVSANRFDSSDPRADALTIYDFVIASLRRHLILKIAPSPRTTQGLSEFALRALGTRVSQATD